jgi:hypothetical protein
LGLGRAGSASVLTVGLAAGLLACQPVGSGAVMTASMYADLGVVASGDGTSRVRATLRLGSMMDSTFVDLQPGDSLSATSGALTQPLDRTVDLLGGFSYTGAFVGDDPGTPFAIAFTRTSDVSAPSSKTILPARVTHLSSPTGATGSRAQALPISWDMVSGSPDLIDVTVEGSCVIGIIKMGQPDTGQVVVGPSDLKSKPDNPQASCPLRITIARKHPGTIDPAFGAGAFYGIQQSTITITSVP